MSLTAPSALMVAVGSLVAAALQGCKDADGQQPAPSPSSTASVIVEEFRPAPSCSCGGFELAYRTVRVQHEPAAEPARRLFVVAEFRLRRDGKDWAFQPSADSPLPQRLYANRLRLAVACSDDRYVVVGPHGSGALAVGRQSWSRRLHADGSLSNYLLRPMDGPAGVAPPLWGEAGSEPPAPDKLQVSCDPLPTDQNWVQIIDWNGRGQWVDMKVGRVR